jgi:hypothetical protein
VAEQELLITDGLALLEEFGCDEPWDIGVELMEDVGARWSIGVIFSDHQSTQVVQPAEAPGIQIIVHGWGAFLDFPFTITELLAAVREQDAEVTEMEFEMATDGLYVVETVGGEAYIGSLSRRKGVTVVHTRLPGRPVHLSDHDILEVTPAAEHPDVELLDEFGFSVTR